MDGTWLRWDERPRHTAAARQRPKRFFPFPLTTEASWGYYREAGPPTLGTQASYNGLLSSS